MKPLPMQDIEQDAVHRALYAYQDFIENNTPDRNESARLAGLFADFMEGYEG